MFGAITNGRPRAKLLYSEYCTHAPQTRYPDWEHVRKQMYKVHAPHIDSGYIASVAYNEVTDDRGNRDGLHAKLELEYEAYRAEETLRCIDAMPRAEYERLHQQHLRWNRGTFKLMTSSQIEDLTKRSVESDIRDSGKVPLLSFEEFCQERKS